MTPAGHPSIVRCTQQRPAPIFALLRCSDTLAKDRKHAAMQTPPADHQAPPVWASQEELVRAMIWHEAKALIASTTPRDPIALAPACSKIADVLGLLWWERRDGMYLQADHRVVALLREATEQR